MVRIVLVLMLAASTAAAGTPYVVPDTEVVKLSSKHTGVEYQLFVALPPGYAASDEAYPVVYMLDADYSFALARNVVQHFVERDDLPPLILVAIAYPGASSSRATYRMNRTRDYTPAYAPDGGYGAEYQQVSGGGPNFRSFIAAELMPFIDRRYRSNPRDRAIVGHSYGGLFATYVLLTEPALFKRYIIVSPSLWYANRIALTMEEAAARSGIRPEARVFFAVGRQESPVMVSDLTELVKRMRGRKHPNLSLTMQIFADERHNSVFPGALTRGLMTVFDRPAAGRQTRDADGR